mgnify:CR=1 FL=1
MDEKRDEFWNEFYKDIPELDPREKEEPAPEAISGCLTIEYINSDGETVGETETVELQTDTPEEVIPEIQAIEPEEQPYQPAAEPQPASEEPQELAFPEDFAIFQPAPEAEEPKISGEWNIETPITVTSEPEPEPHEQKKRKTEEPKIYDPFSDRKFRREQRKKEKKFEVDFDFDEKYPDVNEKIIKQGSVKRTGLVSGILYFIFIVCISVVLAALGWMWATDVLGLFGTDEQITVTVPREIIETKTRTVTDEEGNETEKSYTVADVDYVAEMLYDSGLIKYKWLFKVFCGFSEAAEKVKAGTYVLTGDYDYRALVNGMTPSAGARVEVSVTIPEGHNIFQVVQDLVRNGVCDEEELWDCLTNYEFDYDFVDNSTIGDPLSSEFRPSSL